MAFRGFVRGGNPSSSHLIFSFEDNLADGSASLRVIRGSGESSELIHLTCGRLYPCRLALVSALLCCEQDGVFPPRLQASQDVGGSVSGELHLHRLARGKTVVEAVTVKLGHRHPPEEGQAGLRRFRNPKVLGRVQLWEENRVEHPSGFRQGCFWD